MCIHFECMHRLSVCGNWHTRDAYTQSECIHIECTPTLCVYAYICTLSVCVTWLYADIDTQMMHILKVSVYLHFECMHRVHTYTLSVCVHLECVPTLCVYASCVYTYTWSVCVTLMYVRKLTHKWRIPSKWVYTYTLSVYIVCIPTNWVYASLVYIYTLTVCVTWLYAEIDTRTMHTLKVSVYLHFKCMHYTVSVHLHFVCMHHVYIHTLWVYVSLDCMWKLTHTWRIPSKWVYTHWGYT